MSAEPGVARNAEPEFVDKELAEEWARFRDVLWYGSINDARTMIAEMAKRWPDSERVQHYARVLAPPVAKSVPGPNRSVEKEFNWLKEHAREYPGCWLAVKGDQLVAADPDLKVVEEAALKCPETADALLFYEYAPGALDTLENRR